MPNYVSRSPVLNTLITLCIRTTSVLKYIISSYIYVYVCLYKYSYLHLCICTHIYVRCSTENRVCVIIKWYMYIYTPPSKSLASLWLAGQLVVILLLRWPFFQEYHTEYFKISYDKCCIYDNNMALIIVAENIDFRSYITWLHNRNIWLKNIFCLLVV